MRATVEKHGKCSGDLPEIEVLVAKGEHDVSIRISDQVGKQGILDTILFQDSGLIILLFL